MHVRSLALWRPTYSQLLKYVYIYVCKRSCQTLFRGLSTTCQSKTISSLFLSIFFSHSLSARRCSLTRRFSDLLVNGTPFSCTRAGNRLHSLLGTIQTVCLPCGGGHQFCAFGRFFSFFFLFFFGRFSTPPRLEERNFENLGISLGKRSFGRR